MPLKIKNSILKSLYNGIYITDSIFLIWGGEILIACKVFIHCSKHKLESTILVAQAKRQVTDE